MDKIKNPIDLDKVREDKCIPVARGVLEDMASDMIPEDANVKVDYNPVLLKILKRMFEADTNIAMENPYVFQLLLQVFGGLSRAVQKCDTVLIDDVRYGKIEKEILSIVSKANIRMGDGVKDEDIDTDFGPVKEELNGLFSREKLSMLEVKYMMDNIFDAFNTVQTALAVNVSKSSDIAIAKLFGLEDVNDLTMSKLDEGLKIGVESK